MLHFECDYNNGCHNEVLKRLIETNGSFEDGYGFDGYTESAKAKIRSAVGCENADVFFLVGGTQTNETVIASLLRPYEGVVAAETGHIGGHESGAVEYTGHKVLPIRANEGKISADDLADYLATFYGDANHEHMVFPGMVYISFPTELGTLYSKAELENIHSVCRQYSMPLYIDGARLGYGLASPACDMTLPEFAALCDCFYIGGTKVGALCGEAVVFPQGNAPKHFFSMIKQHGALLAKGRLTGVQFEALFTDDLYLRISAHAIRMAEKLKAALKEANIPFYLETPTNQQFVIMEDEKIVELDKTVINGFWEKYDATHTVMRFCTSWATTEEDIAALAEEFKRIFL